MNKIKLSLGEIPPHDFTGIVEYPYTIHWYKNGIHHRTDGPAIEYKLDDTKTYIVFGRYLTEKQFEIFRFLVENTFLERTDELMETFIKLVRVGEQLGG